ncbi:hypothetical protein CRYUN_Cryun06bG0019900 [Craigia yunnanensis]
MQPPIELEMLKAGPSMLKTGLKEGRFFHGYVLIFNYDPALHNVISVNQVSYDTCTIGSNFKAYHSGHNQIVLAKGWSNFLSNITGDCDNKVKIQVSSWPVLE